MWMCLSTSARYVPVLPPPFLSQNTDRDVWGIENTGWLETMIHVCVEFSVLAGVCVRLHVDGLEMLSSMIWQGKHLTQKIRFHVLFYFCDVCL